MENMHILGNIEIDDGNVNLNDIKNNMVYSTDEKDTGKKWIDGSKIYRKIYSYDTNAPSTITTNLQPKNVIKLSGTYLNSGYLNNFNAFATEDLSYKAYIDMTPSGVIRIEFGSSVKPTNVHIFVEYIK